MKYPIPDCTRLLRDCIGGMLLTLLCGHASAGAPAAPPVSGAGNPAAAGAEEYAPNRILVLARPGLSPANLAKILAPHGGVARRVGASSLHVVALPAHMPVKQVVNALASNPHIKFAELDRRVKASFIPNDPYLGSEWHLTKVGAPAAWNRTAGAGVTIAILDSGVDAAHPDLAPNLVQGYNFIDNNANTADVCGHGTAVAGTAAAASDNGVGVAGAAGKATILPIRVAFFDPPSNSCYAYYSTIASGITYAADRGARIVNVSYGGVAGSATVQNAAQYLKSKGGLLFVSAGNNGINENVTPTNSMIVVSATDSNDGLASWSSYGTFVSLAAPGAGIWTTSRGGIYQQWSGTSFASPLAAGVAALVMAANSSLDNLTVENLLYSTALDLGPSGRDVYFGYGRIDAGASVTAAFNRLVAADTQAPTASITAPGANTTVAGLVAVNVTANDNVGVVRVELKVNGTTVAVDSAAPYGFSWDSAGVSNGMATLVATAFDLAGNATPSAPIMVNVANQILAPAVTWTTCATEGGVCTFANTRQVRYGANNSYATLSANGSIACNNAVFGDPMYGVTKSCQYSDSFTQSPSPAPVPPVETWTACGTEGATCTFTGTRSVRYGINNSFTSKVIVGATACTNAVFGDPAYGYQKACAYSSITQ